LTDRQKLDRLFHPRTIAVVGASDSQTSQAGMNWRLLRMWRPDVELVPVNPKHTEIDGVRCYATIEDVPGEVDVAVVLVHNVHDAVEACVRRAVAFVVVFAAGFAETGPEGRARQDALAALVRGTATRLVGPNTALNILLPVRRDLPGKRIAIITHSGQQGRALYQLQELGIPVHAWAPTGNEADLEAADFLRAFADDDNVGVIACYLEGFKDRDAFENAAAHASARGVPIVAVMVGRTAIGRSWAATHTGHTGIADDIDGIVRVDTLDELADVATMFARCQTPPVAEGVCVYGVSGGAAAQTADLAWAMGLRLPELSDATQRTLRNWIPDYLRVTNPVDTGGVPVMGDDGPKIIDTLLADPSVGVLLVPIAAFFPDLSDKLANDLVAAHSEKPACIVWGSATADEPAYRDAIAAGLPVFRSLRNAITAIRAWLDYHGRDAARGRESFQT
jgi:acyl-CoA synthetase (NDP forming)